eukprot:7795259-Pyramimonas_sp.AAC.1
MWTSSNAGRLRPPGSSSTWASGNLVVVCTFPLPIGGQRGFGGPGNQIETFLGIRHHGGRGCNVISPHVGMGRQLPLPRHHPGRDQLHQSREEELLGSHCGQAMPDDLSQGS